MRRRNGGIQIRGPSPSTFRRGKAAAAMMDKMNIITAKVYPTSSHPTSMRL